MASRTLAASLLLVVLSVARGATAMTVTITADKADVMVGSKVVATVTKGQSFVVSQQRDVWYGIHIQQGEKVLFGWIHSRNCEVQKATTKAGDDPAEAEAEKEFVKRKAQADKLVAEGKWDEAVALFDKFPSQYWKTKAGKKAMQYGGELDAKRRANPEAVEAGAEREFQKRKAEADKLLAAGKLDEAIRVMEGFPASYEKSKWYQEAKNYTLELNKKAHVDMAEFEKTVLSALDAGKPDDALAAVKALEEKSKAGKETYLKFARAFVERHQKAAANPNAPVSSDDGAADVYAEEADFAKQLSRILNFRGPEGITTYTTIVRNGNMISQVEATLPKPEDQILIGEQLTHAFPWSPNVRYYLAKLYVRTGDADKALQRYADVRQLDRGVSILTLDSFIEAARVLSRAKRHPEAVGLLKQALARKADDFIALATLGRVHLAAGSKAEAAAAFEKSLKINPSQPEATRLLAEAKGQKYTEPPLAKLQSAELFKQVEESCVVITATNSSGSGYVISADGMVATNFHVIAPGGKLGVRFRRKGEFVTIPDVQLVLADPVSDIAILKVDARAFPLKPLPLGTAKDVVPGEDIVVIGNPGMAGQILDYTITKGIISNRDREINKIHFFQTDAAVNPGNSGGPLFNMSGQVIGMVTLGTHGMQGTGFALHIDQVKAHFPHCFPDME